MLQQPKEKNFTVEDYGNDVLNVKPGLRAQNRRKLLNPSEFPAHEASASKNNETPAFYVDNQDKGSKLKQSQEVGDEISREPSAEAVYFDLNNSARNQLERGGRKVNQHEKNYVIRNSKTDSKDSKIIQS